MMLYARLRGVLSDEWSEGSPPASAMWLDRFIQHLPFAIGRTAGNDPSIGLTDDPASWWLFPNQSKISRKHVVIRWEGGRYLLKCYGSNGADVNGASLVLLSLTLFSHRARSVWPAGFTAPHFLFSFFFFSDTLAPLPPPLPNTSVLLPSLLLHCPLP